MFLPCKPCCGDTCGVSDSKPRTDPKDEGTWVPSGTWAGVGGVTWTFTPNPGDESGETWFFYGSALTSKPGGGSGATAQEQQDWGNLCNWYSSKTTSPSSTFGLGGSTVLNKRATRLPPSDAVIHVYTTLSTQWSGPQTVKKAYFWSRAYFGYSAPSGFSGAEITATDLAHDSTGGFVFNDESRNVGILNGGSTFNDSSAHGLTSLASFTPGDSRDWTVNGGAVFNATASNVGTVNGGAEFNGTSINRSLSLFQFIRGEVNGGGVFNGSAENSSLVNDGADFFDTSFNFTNGLVNGGATFYNSSGNEGTVNGGGTFNGTSYNLKLVNDSAVFNDSARNATATSPTRRGTVEGGATFNDNSCSERTTGLFSNVPCNRKFVAHPTDLPTCNGTAPAGCDNAADTCGCG